MRGGKSRSPNVILRLPKNLQKIWRIVMLTFSDCRSQCFVFTVYGPWGRPDMALFKFTKAILNEELIDVYNYGDMSRDFTYIDDSGMVCAY